MDARQAATARRRQPGRGARAALASTALVVLTLAGHSAASGTLPGAPGTAMTVLLGVGLTWAVTERRLAYGALLAYLVAAQALLHVVLAVAGHDHGGLVPSASMIAGHLLAAALAAGVLAEADRILARWATLLGHVLGARAPVLPGIPTPPAPAPATRMDAGDGRAIRHALVRRGPPAALALVS